jgi:hypothetical protein
MVPIGVMTQYNGDGPREGERIWICEECAQVEEYARAFVTQARDHFTSFGGTWLNGVPHQGMTHGYSYRIVSPVLREQTDEHGFNRFHEWTMDI